MRSFVCALVLASVSALGVAACGGSSGSSSAPFDPYTSDPGATGIVGDGKATGAPTPTGTGCIQVGNECVRPQDKCGPNARADVIVDSQGRVVEIVCYESKKSPPVEESQGNVELGKDNKTVVELDGNNDGVDIAGDVTSSGNKVSVFGKGPAVSVIGGSVTAGGNNFALRGVTVKKDVVVRGNDATLVYCVIEGNVTIEGNNAVIAECTVFGKITITGNNAKLVRDQVGGGVAISGGGQYCDAVVAFSDANANKSVDPGETGAPITCSDPKGKGK